jgi:UPF0755 protein
MKKLLLLLVAFMTLFSLGGYALFGWWSENIKPVSADAAKTRFTITRGSSAEKIARQLYDGGLIRNPLAFKVYVQINGKADKIQPGVFNISPNMSLSEVVEKLLGRPDEIRITITEGRRREEVAETLIAGLELEGVDVDNFRSEFMAETADKEGFLFPDTYNFLPGTTARQAVSRLTSTFDSIAKDLNKPYPMGYGINEIAIIASLIERETKTDEERPIVAGVLYNRLRRGWSLQVDATVQYAMATDNCRGKTECNWWPVIRLADYEYNSSFNTYRIPGLPPFPIANPGKKALEAAADPADTEYMFYLHGKDGEIRFARTNEEHNANKRNYLY